MRNTCLAEKPEDKAPELYASEGNDGFDAEQVAAEVFRYREVYVSKT